MNGGSARVSTSWAANSCVNCSLPGDAAAPATTIAADGRPCMTIVLAEGAIRAERTAAEELAGYLAKITGGAFAVVGESAAVSGPSLYVGPTAFARERGLDPGSWGPERWAIRTVDAHLVLVGGRPRGTLYAVYHFLEDQLGVRWWNALEEHVPQQPTLQVPALDRHGEPTFRYRDIYLLCAHDGGRFGVRNRLNGQGFGATDVTLGSGVYYGAPNGVHTFYIYIPPAEYFAAHPEWFSLIDGKRTADQAQLCLTNPELRAVVVEKFRGFIEQSRAEAQQARPKDRATRSLPPQRPPTPRNSSFSSCTCGRSRPAPQCRFYLVRTGAASRVVMTNDPCESGERRHPPRCNRGAFGLCRVPPTTDKPSA